MRTSRAFSVVMEIKIAPAQVRKPPAAVVNCMSTHTTSTRTRHFDTQLLCMRCGQEGKAVWENGAHGPGATYPLETSDGFYLRVNVRRAWSSDIVCANCGAVHRDEVA
jgi:hypothetical protein